MLHQYVAGRCRHHAISLGALIATLHMTPAGAAPTAGQDEQVTGLEEIVVTATRVEKTRERIPAAIGLVDRDEVQLGRQQLGLDESLTSVPGVFMQNRFNFAQDLRVSIRGFGARANFGIRGIKIIVDGIPESLPDGQGQVDSIDLGSVQQVEVLRGPVSSLYGNASGGAIIITSEEGPAEPYVETRLSFGEFGFRKHQLKTGGSAGKLNYMVNVSDLELDGYRQQSATESRQLNSRLHYQIDESSDFRVALNLTDQPVSDDPGAITREQAAADPRSARDQNLLFDAGEELEQQRIGLVYNKSFGNTHQITVRNYYVWRDFANKLPFQDGGAVTIDRLFAGGGFMYTNTAGFAGRPNRLIIGVDLDRQDDDRRRFNNDLGLVGDLTFDQNETVTSTGLFVQNELSLREDLELTIGARYDSVEFDVDDDFLADGDDSGSRTLEEFSPMIGLLYAVSPSVNLYANISTSFETPTTTEFANPSGGGGFNPDLDPQTATNYEVGLKGAITGKSWYDIALFKIDIEDELIPFELPQFPGRDFFRNAGESSREGVELSFNTEPVEGLDVSLAYTYSDFTFDKFVDDNGNDFGGNDLPGIPTHLLHGEAVYSHASGFYAGIDALYVDEFYVDNGNTEQNDSYTVANLRMGYSASFGPWSFEPFLGVINLFDESYNDNVRINAFGGRFFEPGPEQNFFGGITFRYDFGG